MFNICDERIKIFNDYIKLGEKVKECRTIVQKKTTLLSDIDIKRWDEMSLDVIGELACLRIKTKALLQRNARRVL